jgi:hypothetical protein
MYDLNRPLTPILRLRRCSLMYDIYWIVRWWCCTVTGSKYLEYNPGSELNIFPVNKWTMNNELNKIIEWKQWAKSEQNKIINQWNKVEQKMNKDKWMFWTTVINRTTIIIHDITVRQALRTTLTNHECLYWNRLKCDRLKLHRVKNIPVIMELTITTLFARLLILLI